MSKNEKDLSNYISYISSDMQMFSVVAGFMFTAITLLVTLLPDPSQLTAQATLFSLSVVFGLCLIIIMDMDSVLIYCIRVAPPLPEGFRKGSEFLKGIVFFALGLPIILMFLLWNLTYLALVTIIVNALLIIFGYLHEHPLWKTRRRFEAETKKSWRIRKFFDERDIILESED